MTLHINVSCTHNLTCKVKSTLNRFSFNCYCGLNTCTRSDDAITQMRPKLKLEQFPIKVLVMCVSAWHVNLAVLKVGQECRCEFWIWVKNHIFPKTKQNT